MIPVVSPLKNSFWMWKSNLSAIKIVNVFLFLTWLEEDIKKIKEDIDTTCKPYDWNIKITCAGHSD